MPSAKTRDALKIIRREFYEGKPDKLAALDAERQNATVARKLYSLRTRAGLTQAQLAQRVGTTTSVISRLENADYRGHSLSMLRRVAAALDRNVSITFSRRTTG
jgi:DNA-binding XRE family transcriptional regulator